MPLLPLPVILFYSALVNQFKQVKQCRSNWKAAVFAYISTACTGDHCWLVACGYAKMLRQAPACIINLDMDEGWWWWCGRWWRAGSALRSSSTSSGGAMVDAAKFPEWWKSSRFVWIGLELGGNGYEIWNVLCCTAFWPIMLIISWWGVSEFGGLGLNYQEQELPGFLSLIRWAVQWWLTIYRKKWISSFLNEYMSPSSCPYVLDCTHIAWT